MRELPPQFAQVPGALAPSNLIGSVLLEAPRRLSRAQTLRARAEVAEEEIEALLANAGRGLGHAFLDQDFEDIRRVIDTNVTGTIYSLHRVGAEMRTRGRGRILITGSIAGFMPGSFAAVYNGTKAFLDSFSFALRNVVDVDAALRELARVTRPGGRLVVCEFSHPTSRVFRTIYFSYLMRSLPAVARAVSSDPRAYVYLAESISAWPDQATLATRVAGAGWGRVAWRNLTGGVVALHRATRA